MIATVFLGPSMPIEEARRILPLAVFRPPAAQGDLLAAASHDGAEVIGLIDGTFHQNLSVWHNEVCYLLSRGITIYGASSMGALRAAETEKFGTVGIGRIYSWYRDGIITADDEVALLHGDQDSNFRPLSEPLVNIRATMQRVVSEGLLGKEFSDRVIEIARSLYYPDRLIPLILQRCREMGLPEEKVGTAERALTTNYVDLKRADAREMLLTIAHVLDGSLQRPKATPFEFARSSCFQTLYDLDRKVETEEGSISLQEIAEHVALHCVEFAELKRSALHRDIVLFLGRLLDVRVTPADIAAEREAFCAERNITSPEHLRQWLQRNACSEDDLSEYLAGEAVCHRLRRSALRARSFDRGCRSLLDELRIRGIFSHWAKEASEEVNIVTAYRDQPDYKYIWSEHPARLSERHAAHGKVHIMGDARVWAEDAGFEGVEQLADAIRRAVIFEDVRDRISRQLKVLEPAMMALYDVATSKSDSLTADQ